MWVMRVLFLYYYRWVGETGRWVKSLLRRAKSRLTSYLAIIGSFISICDLAAADNGDYLRTESI